MSTNTLTFEGVGDLGAVGNYYGGGAGTNYGVTFDGVAGSLVQATAGGSGDFLHNPSGTTCMYLIGALGADETTVMNVSGGFVNQLQFYYSSQANVTIHVYSGANAGGALLATGNFAAQATDGCSDAGFCNWTLGTVAFAGTALSASFAGKGSETLFDNVIFTDSGGGGGGTPSGALGAFMTQTYQYGPGPISASVAVQAHEMAGVFCSTSGTVAIFDGASASGTAVVAATAMTAGNFYLMPFQSLKGQFYVQIAGGAVVTLAFN